MSHYIKKQLISKIAPWLETARLHQLFEPFCAGVGQILTLHRVLPERPGPRIHNHQSLEISPKQLEQTILFYKNNGYRFISLDQLYEGLQQQNFDQPFVAFTFDDGYRDNLVHAYPILKKHQIPFAVYISTHFPDRQAILWWYYLEDLLKAQREVRFEWKGQSHYYACQTDFEKEAAFDAIRQFINANFSVKEHAQLLQQVFGGLTDDLLGYCRSETLSWADIRQLSRDPLVTIGAHTSHHYPLIQLEEPMVYHEIGGSRVRLEEEIGQPVTHFAYPFGKAMEASWREFEAVKTLGFKTATTTRMGNIFKEHGQFTECLPRISLNRASNEQVLRLQMSGMLPYLYHKGKKIITH